MKGPRGFISVGLSLIVFASTIVLTPSSRASSECPQSWQLTRPQLDLKWDAKTQSLTTNLGTIGSYSTDTAYIDFSAPSYEGLLKKLSNLYGPELESRILANPTKISFKSWIVYGAQSSDQKDIDYEISQKKLLYSPWQSSSRDFLGFDPRFLLSQGVANTSILHHLLEIKFLGCTESRFVLSEPEIVEGIPDSLLGFDKPLGLSAWKSNVNEYLKFMIDNTPLLSNRSLNSFNWSVNLEKFDFLVNKLQSLGKDTIMEIDDGREDIFDASAIVKFEDNALCGGEDCGAMVPSLVGFSPAGCLKDLRIYVTPCKVAVIGPDGSKADRLAKSIWAINSNQIVTVISTFEIPKRRLEDSFYTSTGTKLAQRIAINDLEDRDLKGLLSEFERQLALAKIYDLDYGKPLMTAAAEKMFVDSINRKALLRAERDAQAKLEAERKAREEAEAAAKAKAEVIARLEAEADAKAKAAKKETTITCVKGKVTKKVTAVRPKCPSGYKKK